MRAIQSIWLGEYEGLLPKLSTDSDRSRRNESASLTDSDYAAVRPRVELTLRNLSEPAPEAFLE